MKLFRFLSLLLVSLLFSGCLPAQTAVVSPPAPQLADAQPTTTDRQKTLDSLRQVDDHPLFTMTYYNT